MTYRRPPPPNIAVLSVKPRSATDMNVKFVGCPDLFVVQYTHWGSSTDSTEQKCVEIARREWKRAKGEKRPARVLQLLGVVGAGTRSSVPVSTSGCARSGQVVHYQHKSKTCALFSLFNLFLSLFAAASLRWFEAQGWVVDDVWACCRGHLRVPLPQRVLGRSKLVLRPGLHGTSLRGLRRRALHVGLQVRALRVW
jgi:hypothetical protein